MGWRSEARESIDRCHRQAEAARADAMEARTLADELPAGFDRDSILAAARHMEDAADTLTDTACDIRRTLDREQSG